MRVKDCRGCIYCKRYTWSHVYLPAGYHAIGMSHAYHECEIEKKRCIQVSKCPMPRGKPLPGQRSIWEETT